MNITAGLEEDYDRQDSRRAAEYGFRLEREVESTKESRRICFWAWDSSPGFRPRARANVPGSHGSSAATRCDCAGNHIIQGLPTHATLEFLLRSFNVTTARSLTGISQSASLINWFKDYGYPWASADATPLVRDRSRGLLAYERRPGVYKEELDSIVRGIPFHSSE
jgi:hypothetical protein